MNFYNAISTVRTITKANVIRMIDEVLTHAAGYGLSKTTQFNTDPR